MDTRRTLIGGEGGFLPLTNAVERWLVPDYSSPASAKLT